MSSTSLKEEERSLISSHRDGFRPGYTRILREADCGGTESGMDFGIHVFRMGERLDLTLPKECIWVLLHGESWIAVEDAESTVCRDSLFDEEPTALHVGPGTRVRLRAQSDRVEWAFVSVTNERRFSPKLFLPHDVEPEYRGLGLAQGTCLRNVRLIFDRDNRPESNLVIGEVINYPGRWSSYPPHHHAQPEIYHYRFNEPQGYGHGEVGEDVFKVRHNDTLCIPGMHDHAQAAAPGYAMYYMWIVRHLKGQPYEGFEFTPEHEWMLDPNAHVWEPAGGPKTPQTNPVESNATTGKITKVKATKAKVAKATPKARAKARAKTTPRTAAKSKRSKASATKKSGRSGANGKPGSRT